MEDGVEWAGPQHPCGDTDLCSAAGGMAKGRGEKRGTVGETGLDTWVEDS